MLTWLKRTLAYLFVPAAAAPAKSAKSPPVKAPESVPAAPLSRETKPAPKLPAAYRWLAAEPGPRHLLEALALFGTVEVPGKADSPVILGWAKELGLAKTYSDDSIPWCGLFAAIVVKRAGWEPVKDPLWARNWGRFGTSIPRDQAALGDVLVFVRDGGGHVGFYVGESSDRFYVLGGNQTDQVCVTPISKDRCIAVRRPTWRTAQPINVRSIRLSAGGALSTNEA